MRSTPRNASGPRNHGRYPQATLEQFGLPACKRPRVGEAFSAIIAGEDDNCVFCQTIYIQGLEDAADLQIHVLNHALIGLDRPAVDVEQVFPHTLGFGLITGSFPGPVGRIEMKTQEE